MEFKEIQPPREFEAGPGITVRHCADVDLDPDEQVTFKTSGGTELDVVRKAWGYYATPSLNGRLRDHGLRAALVIGANGKMFVHLVEEGREAEFEGYLDGEEMRVVAWLDSDEAVSEAAARLESSD